MELSNKFELQLMSLKNILRSFSFWPRVFHILWKTHPLYFIVILIINIIKGLITSIQLLTIQLLINSVTIAITLNSQRGSVLLYLFIYVGINALNYLLVNVENSINKIYNSMLANRIDYTVMDKATKLSLSSFEDSNVQDSMKRARAEASSRPFDIFLSILNIISSIISLISVSAILFIWKWQISLLLIIIPVVSFFSFLRIGQREFIYYYNQTPKKRKAWYLSFLLTRDNSFKEVKLFRLEDYLLTKYKSLLNQFFNDDKSIAKKRLFTSLFFDFINQFVAAFIIYKIILSVLNKEIMIGNFVSMIQAVTITLTTSQKIIQSILTLCQHNLFLSQLFHFLDLEEESAVGGKQIDCIDSIEFHKVSFKYPKTNKKALCDINLTIKKGESLAIVGKNGSGKSTFVKLLTQLYQNFEGEIFINGISIRNINRDSLTKLIGIVFQDFVQYEMSIRNNVGFGDLKQINNDNKIIRATQCSNIDYLIKLFPEELEAQLGKLFGNGQQLSGGQWQRIAIARGFMRNADVYILDEPSSFLDPQAESEIFKQFKNLISNKIGIFISHRFSTTKLADKIMVLDQGNVIEYGSHAELMNKKGMYAYLYNLQASAYIDR